MHFCCNTLDVIHKWVARNGPFLLSVFVFSFHLWWKTWRSHTHTCTVSLGKGPQSCLSLHGWGSELECTLFCAPRKYLPLRAQWEGEDVFHGWCVCMCVGIEWLVWLWWWEGWGVGWWLCFGHFVSANSRHQSTAASGSVFMVSLFSLSLSISFPLFKPPLSFYYFTIFYSLSLLLPIPLFLFFSYLFQHKSRHLIKVSKRV